MERDEDFKPSGQPVTVRCRNTSQELYHGLILQQKAHGQGKRIFQMILALVLAALMLVSWIRDRTYTMGLILGLVCVGLFFMILLLPGYIMKNTAEMLAENSRELEFRVYENGVMVDDGIVGEPLPGDRIAVYEDREMFVFETKSQRVYTLPKRAAEPLELKVIREMLKKYPTFYLFTDAEGKQ